MYIILCLSFLFFVFRRGLVMGQFFQQDGYENKNFFKLIFHKLQFIDKKLSTLVFIYLIFSIGYKNYFLDTFVLAIMFIAFGIKQVNPTGIEAKKKLILTPRFLRIGGLAFFIYTIFTFILFYQFEISYRGGVYCLCLFGGYLIFAIQMVPFALIISNIILYPFEFFIRSHFESEAKQKLKKINPTIIAITGSFGKTSTKNILNHILSAVAPTITTARSINTLMGITRFIREELNEVHKYFIVEVGTSKRGKISKIAKLITPKFSILSAVGFAHYQNFKNQEELAFEKFSLISSTLKNNGIAVINDLQVDEKYSSKYIHNDNCIFLSSINDDKNHYKIMNVNENKNGVSFELYHNGEKFEISSPLHGEFQTNNIALAIIMAIKIGIPKNTILSLIKTLPQTDHRLEVRNQSNGITVLDDAFNSNVDGFLGALNSLSIIGEGRRKILITPGMVELGSLHNHHHELVGIRAVEVCDVIIAVAPIRIASFVNTVRENMKKGQLFLMFDDLKSAQKWIIQNQKSGDVILYENDLPDVFEKKVTL